jgi:hypothetical protein
MDWSSLVAFELSFHHVCCQLLMDKRISHDTIIKLCMTCMQCEVRAIE